MNTSTLETVSPTDLLRADHDRVKDLFRRFDDADYQTRKSVAREAVRLLQDHDAVEQKLFYPFCREISDRAEQLALRAEEAHHSMNVLIAELLDLPISDRYFAKFYTLKQAALAHFRDEENSLFPVVERSGEDLDELGRDIMNLQRSLEARGIVSRVAQVAGVKTLLGVGAAAAIGYGLYAYFTGDSR